MATHYFGFTGVALYSVGTLFVLILAQLHVAAAVGAFRFKKINPNVDNFVLKNGGDDTSPLLVIHNRDNGATGGLIGFPFQESLALPSSWLDEFTKKEIRAGLARRRLISKKGYRATGLTSAAVFVFVGTLLSALLTVCVFKCRLDASSGVITHSLIFTQWSLIGLLSLSYPNQLAVFFCDEAALQSGGNKPDLTKFIEKLDGLTEPEPQRSGSAQLIFHPIPNFERRMKNTEAKLGLVPWNVARYAIYLSVSGLGLLGRAVHCNAGRPELWIMLPCD